MKVNPSEIALISLLLEVSSSPKSGNVDRCHDTSLSFHHFIISSALSFEAFKMAERGESIGKCIYEAVNRSFSFCSTNVHFGAFLLIIPLVMASKSSKAEEIAKNAVEVVKNSTVEDSVFLLRAYRIAKPRVSNAENYDLEKISEYELREKGLNLYRWMNYAKDNFIARELTSCYPISLKGCRMIRELSKDHDLNYAIVLTYHHLLSELTDPLIVAKFGVRVAEKVKSMAKKALSGGIEALKELDRKLISEGINPGSVADVTSSSIYLSLSEDVKLLKKARAWMSLD